jgi:outer membrane protein TolC
MKPWIKNSLAPTLMLPLLTACTSVNFEQTLAKTNADIAAATQGQVGVEQSKQLSLSQTQSQQAALLERATQLLAQPLMPDDAVQLALVNSPALQAMLAQAWADSANAAQAARIANPVFALSRVGSGNEFTFERSLSVGLLDILLLPQRQRRAQRQIDQTQLLLSAQIISQVGQVRQAWVNAVAAQQSLIYAKQVFESADASAELAKRMLAAGNFNKLLRARQQLFYADAATRLANAQHKLTATREELVRTLGLDAAQAEQMQLPKQLPPLPDTPRQAEEVAQSAIAARLDLRLAQAALAVAAQDQGLKLINTLTDITIGPRRDTAPRDGKGVSERGYEFSIKLPLFDLGATQRQAFNAQTLAAANRLESLTRNASSHLRENYSAYRTRFDLAKHQREELVPLRKLIADENVLRYNGMLIGVFELLADAREQINSVLNTIEAEQQFWLADGVLQASILGLPASNSVSNSANNSANNSATSNNNDDNTGSHK